MTLTAALRSLIAVPVLALSVATAAAESSLTPDQKSEIEQVVREILRENPEILVDAIRALRAREAAARQERTRAALVALRGDLENDPTSPVAGNPDGDVTIVEFFDYRCGFCKQVLPGLQRLIETDGNIRYVLKELPILGPDSLMAARAALAVWRLRPDAYFGYHAALMGTRGTLTEDKVLRLAADAGLEVAKVREEMAAPEILEALERNQALAQALNISGTPAFVVGGALIPRAISMEVMQNLVAEARRDPGKG